MLVVAKQCLAAVTVVVVTSPGAVRVQLSAVLVAGDAGPGRRRRRGHRRAARGPIAVGVRVRLTSFGGSSGAECSFDGAFRLSQRAAPGLRPAARAAAAAAPRGPRREHAPRPGAALPQRRRAATAPRHPDAAARPAGGARPAGRPRVPRPSGRCTRHPAAAADVLQRRVPPVRPAAPLPAFP